MAAMSTRKRYATNRFVLANLKPTSVTHMSMSAEHTNRIRHTASEIGGIFAISPFFLFLMRCIKSGMRRTTVITRFIVFMKFQLTLSPTIIVFKAR